MDENNKENKRGIVGILGANAIHPNLDKLFEGSIIGFRTFPEHWPTEITEEGILVDLETSPWDNIEFTNAKPHEAITESPEPPIRLKGKEMEKVGITQAKSAGALAEAAKLLARSSGLTLSEASDIIIFQTKARQSGRTFSNMRENLSLIYDSIYRHEFIGEDVPKPHPKKDKFIPTKDKLVPGKMNINQKALKKRRKKKKRAKKAR